MESSPARQCKEDIDCAFIGPFDLSVAMGVDFGSKEHEGAIQDILAAAHKAGKKAGIFCAFVGRLHTLLNCTAGSNGAASAKRMAEGFDMVSVCTDIDSLAAQTAKEVEVALKTSVAQQGGYAI
jgi:4-hydroxy-2-oxoheptanedioate aldolase